MEQTYFGPPQSLPCNFFGHLHVGDRDVGGAVGSASSTAATSAIAGTSAGCHRGREAATENESWLLFIFLNTAGKRLFSREIFILELQLSIFNMSSQSKKNKFHSELPMRMVNSCICVMTTYTWEQQELNKEKRQKQKKIPSSGVVTLGSSG